MKMANFVSKAAAVAAAGFAMSTAAWAAEPAAPPKPDPSAMQTQFEQRVKGDEQAVENLSAQLTVMQRMLVADKDLLADQLARQKGLVAGMTVQPTDRPATTTTEPLVRPETVIAPKR
jgi:hypothetical protein